MLYSYHTFTCTYLTSNTINTHNSYLLNSETFHCVPTQMQPEGFFNQNVKKPSKALGNTSIRSFNRAVNTVEEGCYVVAINE